VVCQEVSQTECCALQGVFAGLGSRCATFNCGTLCRGDLDGNSKTDVFDFGIFAANFAGTFPAISGRCDGDLNCDGIVDVFDFGIFAGGFGCTSAVVPAQCCGPNAP
jgi:hypothetical protein